ncbi:hypothetical protein ACHHYP_07161 [Achlya hypogyna]|uniref:Uncharacterized protein n=1 Tax=Achlya hypogyna TaxID=1202772 RepID=A0A1V9ZMM5_ACHHY|nr:hypothetical protein ACHHYP_07161 [Achlya hypogyna]
MKKDERTIMTACISPINVKHTSIFSLTPPNATPNPLQPPPDSIEFHREVAPPDSIAFHRKHAPPDSIALHRKHHGPPSSMTGYRKLDGSPDSLAGHRKQGLADSVAGYRERFTPPDSMAHRRHQTIEAPPSTMSTRRGAKWLFDYQESSPNLEINSFQPPASSARGAPSTPVSTPMESRPKAVRMHCAPNSMDDIRLHQFRSQHVRLDPTMNQSVAEIQQRYALLRRSATFEEKLYSAMSRIPRDLRGAPKKTSTSTKRVQFLDECVNEPPLRTRLRRSSC